MVKSFLNSVGNTIGANYENSLDQVNQPGKGPGGSDGYYVPGANPSTMDCPTMKANYEALESQINYWYGILQTGNNSNKERDNLNKIINTQKSKKEFYSTMMLQYCTIVPGSNENPNPAPPPVPDPVPDVIDDTRPDGTTDTNSGDVMTWITANPMLAAAAAIALIVVVSMIAKKNKGSRRRSTTKKRKAA